MRPELSYKIKITKSKICKCTEKRPRVSLARDSVARPKRDKDYCQSVFLTNKNL